MNEIEISLENVNGEEGVRQLFGEVFALGGPEGNFACAGGKTGGWGRNWDALSDSLGCLDTGGIWGTSKKIDFPLKIKLSHCRKFAQQNPKEFKILTEILSGTGAKYKKHQQVFDVQWVD